MTERDLERLAFLATVAAAPDDMTQRLMFADWLEEHCGENHKATYIREHIAKPEKTHWFAEGKPATLHWCQKSGKWQIDRVDPPSEYATFEELEMAKAVQGVTWCVRRGFAEGVRTSSERLAEIGDELVKEQPIQFVDLTTPAVPRFGTHTFRFPGCVRFITREQVSLQRIADGEKNVGPSDTLHEVHILRAFWPSIPRDGWTLAPTPARPWGRLPGTYPNDGVAALWTIVFDRTDPFDPLDPPPHYASGTQGRLSLLGWHGPLLAGSLGPIQMGEFFGPVSARDRRGVLYECERVVLESFTERRHRGTIDYEALTAGPVRMIG